jgi:hypothetical protein
MLLYWRKGKLEFTTDVEDWMSDHEFTEVFSYNGRPSSVEMEITRELDAILLAVRYGPKGIKETLDEMAKSRATLVAGKPTTAGQQSRGAAEGTAVDEVFKYRLLSALEGRLNKWKQLLTVTPRGTRGADVISPSLKVAWDVTTIEEVWKHVERDVFGKRGAGKPRIGDVWDRYYVLVWDEPRTNRTTKVRDIQAGRVTS